MPTLFPLDDSLGASFIGIIISTGMWGISCLQVWLYFTEYSSNDGTFFRLFVIALIALDTLHAALISTFYYHYTVTNFGSYLTLLRTDWSIVTQVGVESVISLSVQFFFAYRIYRLSGKRLFIPIVICICGVGHFACGIGFMVLQSKLQLILVTNELRSLGITAFASNVVCDSVISISLVYLLLSKRDSSQFQTVTSILNASTRYAINTGVLTSIFSITTVVMFATAKPESLIYIPFFFVLARLYVNSFMATLNSRHRFRETIAQEQSVLTPQSTLVFTPNSNASKSFSRDVKLDDVGIQPSAMYYPPTKFRFSANPIASSGNVILE